MAPHPLDILTVEEVNRTRDIVKSLHSEHKVFFREIYLDEPSKSQLTKYLEAEHAGQTPSPVARQALSQYDVLDGKGGVQSHESIIDLESGKRIHHVVVPEEHHASLSTTEFQHLIEACGKSQLFKDAVEELKLPDGFEVVIEPWPYGGLAADEENNRYFQGLLFGRDTRPNNPDSNFYAFPLPLIPVMNARTREIVRVDRLPTGGDQDGLQDKTHTDRPLDHCQAADYVPELLPQGPRKTLKALNVVQPDGPSFSVDGGLVEWEHWRFRVGFNPREGATIHDVHFQGRSVMYRLSISEMTVPYADPRSPFPRKQAFDFGDGSIGHATNNLKLGCDCLGVIKYFDGVITDSDGKASVAPNVICLHEQDNGIGWKHTNWRTGRAVVTRSRELVVQFIITLANYEYVFAYKFDLAGGITVETRATGIVSVVNIDPGKTSKYGNVVSPGALAQNHQHIFCVRMDPAVDGYDNTVLVEESHPVPFGPKNPAGNLYEVRREPVEKSRWIDAASRHNRVVKLVNESKTNPVSGRPVGYKFTPADTQLLLAQPEAGQAQRALFAQHHVWVTKYLDRELYAGGRYPLQSKKEVGGLGDAVKREDDVKNTDVVVWSVFGLTHNPRVEDWPVMPAEVHQINLRPADFFTQNPSIDVPSSRNMSSVLANDRAVLQPGRPSKRRTLAHRNTAVSNDDVAVEDSSPEESSLSLVQTVDPLTRAVHGFQQQEIRRLEYFFDHEHLDTFVSKVLYGPSFKNEMKVRLVSQFLQHPAALKDAFLACEAAVAVGSPKAGDSLEKLQVMRRTSNAVSSLQWANPSRIEDVAAVLSLALIIITVNDLVIGQPTRAILRSALLLARPWSEQVAQPSSPWFDFNIICLLFAEIHECLLHAEVPVFRFEYNGVDTYVDRYYGICYRLLPILYDVCVLASTLRLGQHPDTSSDLLISQLLTQLDTWPAEPTIEDIEEHDITAQELRHIVRQAWCYKAMAKIVLCYLIPTSRARTLVGQVLSEDIRNEISTGRKYSSGGGQYLLFPYFVACFDLEDLTEQQDVANQMESITEGMAPKACESMCRFLQHIWSVRLLHCNPSWETMRDQSPTIALGP